MLFVSPHEVKAAEWEIEDTNTTISAGSWWNIGGYLTTGTVFSGFFETHIDTDGLDFFICDSANLALWESTGSATVYEQKVNYHTAEFDFTIPYSDTWAAIFSNRYGASSVSFDVGADSVSDHRPSYSPTTYDHTEYGIVLEPDEYYSLSTIYGTGSTISGHVSTWFSTDGIDVFFCDETNYNIFTTGGTPIRYDLKENYHITTFGEFTVPYDGRWYVVFSAADQADTVTISLGMDYTDLPTATGTTSESTPEPSSTTSESTTTSTTESTPEPTSSSVIEGFELGGLGFVLIGGILLIVVAGAVVCSRRRPSPPSTPGAYEVITPGPGPSAAGAQPASPITHVGPKVLVICPYCGAKTEQGILVCQNCGADL